MMNELGYATTEVPRDESSAEPPDDTSTHEEPPHDGE
jgi:hypothetical protein